MSERGGGAAAARVVCLSTQLPTRRNPPGPGPGTGIRPGPGPGECAFLQVQFSVSPQKVVRKNRSRVLLRTLVELNLQ